MTEKEIQNNSSGININEYYIYFTLFISGAIILVIELAGARMLSPIFGSTIYVWSSMIIVTLGSLAFGYYFGGILADKKPQYRFFYLLLFSGGAASLFLIKINQYLLVFSDHFFGIKFGPLMASILIFVVPIVLMSVAGPFAIRLLSKQVDLSGKVSGRVFAISTLGSLFGAVITGFFLLPNVLLISILFWATSTVMVVSVGGLIISKSPSRMLLIVLVVGVIIILLPHFYYHDGNNNSVVLHHEPSFFGDLKVVDLPNVRILMMDGVAQSVFDKKGEINNSLYLREFNRIINNYYEGDLDILVLGFGVGAVTKVLNSGHRVDYVDIESKMFDLAESYFNLQKDANDRFIVKDARSFLRSTEKKYDIILVDVYTGNNIPAHTSTVESLTLMQKHLKPTGALISNVIGYSDDELIKSLNTTNKIVFPDVRVSRHTKGLGNMLVIAQEDEGNDIKFEGLFREVDVEENPELIITDQYNPLGTLLTDHLVEFIKTTKEVLGYSPLFAV